MANGKASWATSSSIICSDRRLQSNTKHEKHKTRKKERKSLLFLSVCPGGKPETAKIRNTRKYPVCGENRRYAAYLFAGIPEIYPVMVSDDSLQGNGTATCRYCRVRFFRKAVFFHRECGAGKRMRQTGTWRQFLPKTIQDGGEAKNRNDESPFFRLFAYGGCFPVKADYEVSS